MNKSTQQSHPIKVIQFGEGNFIRAFVDWMVDILNERSDFNGSVAIVQPRVGGIIQRLVEQDNQYHILLQGLEESQTIDEIRKITCISKCVDPYKEPKTFFALAKESSASLVFSNTTEAGITFDVEDIPEEGKVAFTYPGKLTQLLKRRFDHFKGDVSKGLAIIPCELIEENGDKLKKCIRQFIQLWNLEPEFKKWVHESCSFANTLVDRIVPGYPRDEISALTGRIGMDDKMIVKSELFHLFVLQADEHVKKLFPAHQHGLNVKYVDDVTPYRIQKVRILNGAHTCMVAIGLLHGLETVSETINDQNTGNFINELIYKEIVPTIQIPKEDSQEFANSVITRFQNPFIRHELISISLNSISKFKVRVLPTLKDYTKQTDEPPARITFALACLIRLYTSGQFQISDDPKSISFFKEIRSLDSPSNMGKVLSNETLWGEDLTSIKGLSELVLRYSISISQLGMDKAIKTIP